MSSIEGRGSVMVQPSISGSPGSRSIQAAFNLSYRTSEPSRAEVGMKGSACSHTFSSFFRLAAARSMARSNSSSSMSTDWHQH
ncbi:hypothetical protein ADL32_24695 [Streptomyces albidoflavus]|nr:hypothetical protein ADL32_24695 [Streptomyces albidoflavus]